MPTYYFACECGKLTEVEPSRAGTAFSCYCGRQTVLPSLRHLVRKDMAAWSADSGQLQGRSGLEVTARCLNWQVQTFTVPRVVINGEVRRGSWGTSFFELGPGSYYVEVYFFWLFMKCGACHTRFEVLPERVVEMKYVPPRTMFGEGEFQLRE